MVNARGGGVLLEILEILGGGVPPGSPNPDPISDQKMSFSTPVFRPGLLAEIMSSLFKLERKQNNASSAFPIHIFLFRCYSFGMETITVGSYAHVLLSKTIPNPRPK